MKIMDKKIKENWKAPLVFQLNIKNTEGSERGDMEDSETGAGSAG